MSQAVPRQDGQQSEALALHAGRTSLGRQQPPHPVLDLRCHRHQRAAHLVRRQIRTLRRGGGNLWTVCFAASCSGRQAAHFQMACTLHSAPNTPHDALSSAGAQQSAALGVQQCTGRAAGCTALRGTAQLPTHRFIQQPVCARVNAQEHQRVARNGLAEQGAQLGKGGRQQRVAMQPLAGGSDSAAPYTLAAPAGRAKADCAAARRAALQGHGGRLAKAGMGSLNPNRANEEAAHLQTLDARQRGPRMPFHKIAIAPPQNRYTGQSRRPLRESLMPLHQLCAGAEQALL